MKKFAILIFLFIFITTSRAMPDIRNFKLFQANSLLIRKQYEAAIKTYKEILLTAVDENEIISCRKGIAEGYDKLGNFEEAAKEYEILVKNYPAIPEINMIRARLSELYQMNNNPEKQLEILEEMAGNDPFNIDLEERLFRAYEKRNILNEKIKNLENELASSPEKNLIRQRLVNFYLWQKKYKEAISVWEKNPVKDYYYFETLGDLYFGSGRENEAISIWKNIFFQKPNEQTLQTAVFIFNKKGLAGEALDCYLEARKKFDQPFIYHREIFEIYLLQAQNGPAFAEMLGLLDYSPDNLPLVIFELNEILKDVKDPELMIEMIKTEISGKPDSGYLYQLLGEIYLGTNHPDLAIPYFEKAGELNKNKEIVLVQLGEKLINKNFYNEAVKTYTKIKDNRLFGPLANYQIALSFYNLGSYDSSINILDGIINENMPEPYFAQAVALKGEILFETRNLPQAKEALSFFNNLPGQSEIKNKAFFRSAEIEFLLGNFPGARDRFTTVMNNRAFENFYSSAIFYLAEADFLEDEFEKAKASFEDFAKRFPNESQANKTLLRLVLLNKNKENEAGLKALTSIIREKNRYKLFEAENNANDFISKNPNSQLLVYFLMELGEAYSLENKWPEALKIYENINKMDSYFYKQEAAKQLASIYEINFKDNAKARAEYIKLLTDFPENPVIEIIRKKIEELKP